MSDIIREIDEDLKAQRYRDLARKYAKYVLVVVVLVTSSFGFYAWWQNRLDDIQTARALAYAGLLAEVSSTADFDEATMAEDFLTFASAGAVDGFARMARRHAVALYVRAGDNESALEVLQAIQSDTGEDSEYRAYASVIAALLDAPNGEPLQDLDILGTYAAVAQAIAAGDNERALEILDKHAQASSEAETLELFRELRNAIESQP